MVYRRTIRRVRGFTLIELLLALVLTTVLAGGLYQAIQIGGLAQKRSNESARLNQIGRAVLEILRRDFDSLVQEQSPFNEGLYGQSDESADFPADSVTFLTCSEFPLISSSTTVNYAAADRPVITDLLHVEYNLSDEISGGLLRRSQRCLTCTLFDDEDTWTEENLGVEVLGLNIRYYDGEAAEWKDEWDSLELEAYPEALEVTVIVGLVKRDGGQTLYIREDGGMVETQAFRTRITLRLKPQQKKGAQSPVEGVVR